ncbi:MAG: TetR/AcrR family transcriptional regulator [Marmoricola sp.]|jgi:AcrR family transcriptional regulator|nr:TetR/AcrR family transcriptional regulator [Marmoricola sp.]
MNTKRTYTMRVRADGVEETRRRILQATFDLHSERLISEIVLDDVAERAGVSVQTVLRQFGSRGGLLEATATYANGVVVEERRAPVGDVVAAVRTIVEHYELRGHTALMMLAQEGSDPSIRGVTEMGRQTHRAWVEECFAPYLVQRRGAAREALIDLLVVSTDVYTWKLLRRDRGLSRATTEQRMTQLLNSLLGETAPEA